MAPPYIREAKNVVYDRQGSILSRPSFERIVQLHDDIPVRLITYKNQLLVIGQKSIYNFSERENLLKEVHPKENVDLDINPIAQIETDLLYPAFAILADVGYVFYYDNLGGFIKLKEVNMKDTTQVIRTRVLNNVSLRNVIGLFAFVSGNKVKLGYCQKTTAHPHGEFRVIHLDTDLPDTEVDFVTDSAPTEDIVSFKFILGRVYYKRNNDEMLHSQVWDSSLDTTVLDPEIVNIANPLANATLASGKTLFDFRRWTKFNIGNSVYVVLWSPQTGFYIANERGLDEGNQSDIIIGHFNANLTPTQEEDFNKMVYLGEVYPYGDRWFFPVLRTGQIETVVRDEPITDEDNLLLEPVFVEPDRPLGVDLVSFCFNCSKPDSAVINGQMVLSGSTLKQYDGQFFSEFGFTEKPVIKVKSNDDKWVHDTSQYVSLQNRPVSESEKVSISYGSEKVESLGIVETMVMLAGRSSDGRFTGLGGSIGSWTTAGSAKLRYQDFTTSNNRQLAGGLIYLSYDNTEKRIQATFFKGAIEAKNVGPQAVMINKRLFVFHLIDDSGANYVGYHYTEENPFSDGQSYNINVPFADVYRNMAPVSGQALLEDETDSTAKKVVHIIESVYRIFKLQEGEIAATNGFSKSLDVSVGRSPVAYLGQDDFIHQRGGSVTGGDINDRGVIKGTQNFLKDWVDNILRISDNAYLSGNRVSAIQDLSAYSSDSIRDSDFPNSDGFGISFDGFTLTEIVEAFPNKLFRIYFGYSGNSPLGYLGRINRVVLYGSRGQHTVNFNRSERRVSSFVAGNSARRYWVKDFIANSSFFSGTITRIEIFFDPDTTTLDRGLELSHLDGNPFNYYHIYENQAADNIAVLEAGDIGSVFQISNVNTDPADIRMQNDSFQAIGSNKYYKELNESLNEFFINDEDRDLRISLSYFQTQVEFSTLENLLKASIYKYICRYKWVDERGVEHRSQWSEPVQVAKGNNVLIGDGNPIVFGLTKRFQTSRVVLEVNFLHYSLKRNVRIEIYRTWNLSNSYRFLKEIGNFVKDQTGNIIEQTVVPNTQSVEVIDDVDDRKLGQLVNPNNVVVNGCKYVIRYKERIVLYGFPNRKNVALVSSRVNPTLNLGISFDYGDYHEIIMNEEIVKVAVMDETLVIFTTDNTYTWTVGTLNPKVITGLSGLVILLAENSPVVEIPTGLMFVAKTGIHLLSRALTAMYVGEDVHDFFRRGDEIIEVETLKNVHEVRFLMKSGSVLVYNYRLKNWSTFANAFGDGGIGAISQRTWKGRWLYMDNTGSIYKEAESEEVKEMLVETGWIQLGKIENFQKISDFMLLARFSGLERLSCQLAYDYFDHVTQTIDFNLSKLENPPNTRFIQKGIDDNVEWRFKPARRKCSSVKLRFLVRSKKAELFSLKFNYILLDTRSRVSPAQEGG